MTRRIQWLSALDKKNQTTLDELQKKMIAYYSKNEKYYSDISFTENVWKDTNALPQQDILSECQNRKNILEIGCGEALILRTEKIEKEFYTGVDYSTDLINKNRAEYPTSNFLTITESNVLPFAEQTFDLVFSHFVIEHTVYPNIFLDECIRVLKPNGTLIIAAPNFMGQLGISSQKVGFSKGTGREKLKDGRYLDMIVTAFDSKIRIPVIALGYKLSSLIKPRFFININPTCFIYNFSPDVDAVYLTYKKEIKTYLSTKIQWLELNYELDNFISKNNLIYVKGLKRFN